MDVQSIYARRFTPDLKFREEMWKILCRDFFQKYIIRDSRVIEIGAGYCEFINNIQAAHKTAVDINPDVRNFAAANVEIVINSTDKMTDVADNSADVVFASNLFEHLTRSEIIATFREVYRVLAPGGKFMVLQPNIRFCGKDYWMFFDHVTPIDDRAFVEALEINRFEIVQVIDRFLPYTTKSRLPKTAFLVKLYLRDPDRVAFLWSAIVYPKLQTGMSVARIKYVDIVIPVYNEGDNIRSLLEAFERDVHTPIRILICYDNEADTTLTALREISTRFEIVLVKNEGRYAHGAVMSGFRFSDAPAVISYMADDDYNAALIDKMVDLFRQGNDIVCASRFIPGGTMVGCPWQKELLVRIAAFSLYYFGRLPVHDPTNAFRLISRKLLEKIDIESSEGFTYSIEILAKCHRLGLKMSEVPAQWFERTQGESRFKVYQWATAYLHWFFYIFETTYWHGKSPLKQPKL